MRCKLYAFVVSVKSLFGPITFNDIVFCQCGSQSRPFFLISRSSFIQSGERTLQRAGRRVSVLTDNGGTGKATDSCAAMSGLHNLTCQAKKIRLKKKKRRLPGNRQGSTQD